MQTKQHKRKATLTCCRCLVSKPRNVFSNWDNMYVKAQVRRRCDQCNNTLNQIRVAVVYDRSDQPGRDQHPMPEVSDNEK